MPDPRVVHGVGGLDRPDERIAVSVGVFDGLHRGHAHLLAALADAAAEWRARPAVVTFDAHPDSVLQGEAPPLLLDPAERLERIAEAGIAILVVEHFDDRLRTTPYDAFVRSIASRAELAGFVMTPESAFGHERRGTPDAVAALGREIGYEVEVVPPLLVDGRSVSSSTIRKLVATGDLEAAAELLGRAYAVVGHIDPDGRMAFPLPVALPPDGEYAASIRGRRVTLTIDGSGVTVDRGGDDSTARVRVVFGSPELAALPDRASAGTIRRS
ncbi:MAG TPA: FAD synthetase family protein [Candidatus Limnocylindrales bacterium]|nr:FAD synthetase family protein [Candidatus Limnocylindrales bacterium]